MHLFTGGFVYMFFPCHTGLKEVEPEVKALRACTTSDSINFTSSSHLRDTFLTYVVLSLRQTI